MSLNDYEAKTIRRQNAFLAAYEIRGVVSQAARDAGVSVRAHSNWLNDDEDYAERFHDAHIVCCDLLEAEARRRAVEGVEEEIYFQGEVVGSKMKYSDTILMFLIKGALPDKYADRKQLSGYNGGALEIVESIITVDGAKVERLDDHTAANVVDAISESDIADAGL